MKKRNPENKSIGINQVIQYVLDKSKRKFKQEPENLLKLILLSKEVYDLAYGTIEENMLNQEFDDYLLDRKLYTFNVVYTYIHENISLKKYI